MFLFDKPQNPFSTMFTFKIVLSSNYIYIFKMGTIIFILYLLFIGWLLSWAEGAGSLGVIIVMAVAFFIMYLFFSSGGGGGSNINPRDGNSQW